MCRRKKSYWERTYASEVEGDPLYPLKFLWLYCNMLGVSILMSFVQVKNFLVKNGTEGRP